jgi:hypothetical protein
VLPHASSENAQAERSGALIRVDPLAPEWNKGLGEFGEATVFHTGEWARVLIDSYGYKPYYFTGRQKGRPIRLCLFEIDSWLTGKRAASLPFTDEAPVLGQLPAAGLKAVLTAVAPFASGQGWKSIEVRGAPDPWHESTSNRFYSHELDLSIGAGELFGSFHESARRAVRKAERLGVQVEITQDESAVGDYFELHCLTRKKHGIPPQPFRFFRNIHRHLVSPGLGFTALAKLNQQFVAGAIFLRFGNKALYKFGASNPKADNARSNNLVMWKAIEHLSSTGASTLSFGRTDLHQDGLRRYKLGWGATETILSYIKYDPGQRKFLSSDGSPTSNRLARHLPTFVMKRLGAALYRHVG